jgi:hypothetical protein
MRFEASATEWSAQAEVQAGVAPALIRMERRTISRSPASGAP